MNSSINTSASGMIAQQRMIDVIANNLANVNTTAFKRSRVNFEDVLYETLQGARSRRLPGDRDGRRRCRSARACASPPSLRIHSQGAAETDRASARRRDRGRGLLPGPAARRHHRLHARRQLHALRHRRAGDQRRLPVLPGVTIPPDATAVTISANGIVSVTAGRHTSQIELGRIELARFLNPCGLAAIGENQYIETDGRRASRDRVPAGGRLRPGRSRARWSRATSRSSRR